MLFGVADTYSPYYSIRENGSKTLAYSFYENMVARCYYPKTARYESYGGIGVEVDKEWLSFHNFAEWFYDHYVDGFNLDKDILSEDGMVYSKEDCCFVPREINNLFVLSNRKVNRKLNEGLPSGVFRDRGKFYGRYKNARRYFEDEVSARNFVWAIKFEKCKSLLEHYKSRLDKRVYQSLSDRDFFMITLQQMDTKREVKVIE